MKKIRTLAYAAIALFLANVPTACGNDESTGSNTGGTIDESKYVWSKDGGLNACDHILFAGNTLGNGDDEFVFNGKQILPKGTYTLKGWIYIANGAELTLQPGTVIKGDKTSKASLIVERGGKLHAQGTKSEPIVFTSAQPKGNRKPGDWGGIILCGKAPNNQKEMQIEGGPRTRHGGSDPADNSGTLSYVRIEFAGYPFQANQEINGLTMGSVGSGTKIDHIQVSYSNDDSYEWFGGTVNCKHLIAYKGWDDDFDTDNGFCGKVQFCLSIRDSRIADTSNSNGFESDNWKDGTNLSPMTRPVFSNVTFIGPKAMDESFVNEAGPGKYINGGNYNPNNGSALGRYQAAIQIRRYSNLSCFNSIAVGYPVGLIIENDKGDAQGSAAKGELKLRNIWFADMALVGSDKNSSFTTGEKAFSKTFFETQPGNKVVTAAELGMKAGNYLKAPCIPGKEAQTAASFADAMLSEGFEQVAYIGAFGGNDNWLEGWTNFDPNNTNY